MSVHTTVATEPSRYGALLAQNELLLSEILKSKDIGFGVRDDEAARLVPEILDQAFRVHQEDPGPQYPSHIAKALKAAELLKLVPSIPRDAPEDVRRHERNFMDTRTVLWHALWNGLTIDVHLGIARAILLPGMLSVREQEAMREVMRKHVERLAEYPIVILEKILSVADHSCDMYVYRFIQHAVVARSSYDELLVLRDIYRKKHNRY